MQHLERHAVAKKNWPTPGSRSSAPTREPLEAAHAPPQKSRTVDPRRAVIGKLVAGADQGEASTNDRLGLAHELRQLRRADLVVFNRKQDRHESVKSPFGLGLTQSPCNAHVGAAGGRDDLR
jgi:hypothetical protein